MSANLPESSATERMIQRASEGLRASAGSKVYLVLAALVIFHLFVCSTLSVMGLPANGIPQLPAFLWIGTMFSQPALVAGWFVLGAGKLTFRLATLLILMGTFAVAHLWGTSWNQGETLQAHDLTNGVVFSGICLAVCLPLCLLRNQRWRMTNPFIDEAASSAQSSPNAFTTRHLMYFIAGVALPLTLLGVLIRRVSMLDSTGWVGSVASGLGTASVMGLASAPLFIALLGTMLATTHQRRFVIALIIVLTMLTVAAAGFTIAIGEPSALMQMIQILLGYCGAAALSLWVMKCCGYRLTRSNTTQVHDVSLRHPSALLPLSVLGLLFVMLLVPAAHLVDYRRAHGSEFEWRRRGVAVLVEDGQVTYARILNSGGNRVPVSNALLKDLLKVPSLRHVELTGSGITDRQLELIGKVSSLETLDLSQTSIGDTGIQHLVYLDKLRHLKLMGSKVTEEGIQQLRATLPNCDIQPGGVQPTRVTLPARTNVPDQSQE